MTDLELWEKADKLLVGEFQTLSKGPSRYPFGIAPKFLDRAKGAYVYSLDGRKFIDLPCSLGPVILGYSDPAVNAAVIEQITRGPRFTLGSRVEIEVAELITSLIPSIESVRYGLNGTDATNAAVRLARYETGKPHHIFIGYHGTQDSYISTTENDGGTLPELKKYNHQLRWGDVQQLLDTINKINNPEHGIVGGLAGIMAEVPPPVYGDNESFSNYSNFLSLLVNTANNNGGIFTLDEVVTYPRVHPSGAQKIYGITPDLTCLSKGIGNGFAVSVIGGRRDLISHFNRGKVFMSHTFAGGTIGLTAASIVLSAFGYTNVWEHLKLMGGRLIDSIFDLIKHYHIPAILIGDYSRMLIKFSDVDGIATSDELKTLFQQCMCLNGVLAGGPIFPLCCYTNEIVFDILYAVEDTFNTISKALGSGNLNEYLKCPVISDVFTKRYDTSNQDKVNIVW